MAWKVAWTEVAWSDASAVADYIAKDSSRYAAASVREVREAARSLAEFPERGRLVPELRDPQVRELFVRDYRLIYRRTGTSSSLPSPMEHASLSLSGDGKGKDEGRAE